MFKLIRIVVLLSFCFAFSQFGMCLSDSVEHGSFEMRLVSLELPSKDDLPPELRLCLKTFERPIKHNTNCVFGEKTVDADRLRNGTAIAFNFAWTASFTLIAEVWSNSGTKKELVFDDGFQREGVLAGGDWQEEVLYNDRSFRMRLAFRVICAKDYYGDRCATHCSTGTGNSYGHFVCTANGTAVCAKGWTGKDCADALCSGCLNGVCDRPGSCKCKKGWTGANCDQCETYPGCKHGTCNVPNECICDEGWGGHFCNEDLNYCTTHRPCRNNAVCRNTGHGQYTCECLLGFSGTNCETIVHDCSLRPCLNGGSCQETGIDYVCHCPSGFSGKNCQFVTRSCADHPCQNGGICRPSGPFGRFTCECPRQWTGPTCDVPTGACARDPCRNGGVCVDQAPYGYKCECAVGFVGPTCEESANECQQNPCMNGGRCIDEVNNYKCKCLDGFAGTLCQDVLSACDMDPCANGATCIPRANGGFVCECPRGFRGRHCDIVDAVCLNGGTPSEMLRGRLCICPDCFAGERCEIRTDRCHEAVASTIATKDKLLIVFSACCMLLMIAVALLIFHYRRRLLRPTIVSDPSTENDLNARIQSKYKERKQCNELDANSLNDICYCERRQPSKSQMSFNDKRRSLRLQMDDSEYGQRYAMEPTNRYSAIAVSGNNDDCCASRKLNGVCIPPRLALPSSPHTDSDSVYEEIDSTPPSMSLQGDSDSGLSLPDPDDCAKRECRNGIEFADRQTNL